MPLLKIVTNKEFDHSTRKNFLKQASSLLSVVLGKSEKYVMTVFQPLTDMTFAGDEASAAYIEVKSIGLTSSQSSDLSKKLCQMVDETLGIATSRIYVEFSNAQGPMWGWNGQTF